MKKIVALSTSNSSTSINHQLLTHTASLMKEYEVEIVKLTDFSIPLYSEDIEKNEGIPSEVKRLNEVLKQADNYIISLAEHNGNFSAFFKNIIDWLSRNQRDFFENKKILLVSTSPGPGGASSVQTIAENTFPFFSGEVIASYNLPVFYDNFAEGKISNSSEQKKLEGVLQAFEEAIYVNI